MRGRRFIILVLSLLFTLVYVQGFDVPTVDASTIYQGDLVLTGNNVTTIEGRFDNNGSIIVEDNATLILQNAVLNFTQSQSYQYNITLGPSDDNPQLLVYNSTVTTSSGYLRARAHKSYVEIDNSTFYNINLGVRWYSVLSISNNSYFNWFLSVSDNTPTIISNSLIKNFYTDDLCDTQLFDSEIDVFSSSYREINCTISELEPGLVSYWSPTNNHTFIIPPEGRISNVTLTNTLVNNWEFYFEVRSNVTINSSTIYYITASYNSSVSLKSTTCKYAYIYMTSALFVTDSSMLSIRFAYSSNGWLLNSTYSQINLYSDVTPKVYVSWYLDVHVVDSIDQDVPSASIIITFPNSTVADSKLTDASGLARFPLLEKMVNGTGEYPVGNYTVETTYETYLGSTTVNMTETQELTLTLENFIIPELSSSVLLSVFIIATIIVIIVNRRKQ